MCSKPGSNRNPTIITPKAMGLEPLELEKWVSQETRKSRKVLKQSDLVKLHLKSNHWITSMKRNKMTKTEQH
jgi:hypothetical protein